MGKGVGRAKECKVIAAYLHQGAVFYKAAQARGMPQGSCRIGVAVYDKYGTAHFARVTRKVAIYYLYESVFKRGSTIAVVVAAAGAQLAQPRLGKTLAYFVQQHLALPCKGKFAQPRRRYKNHSVHILRISCGKYHCDAATETVRHNGKTLQLQTTHRGIQALSVVGYTPTACRRRRTVAEAAQIENNIGVIGQKFYDGRKNTAVAPPTVQINYRVTVAYPTCIHIGTTDRIVVATCTAARKKVLFHDVLYDRILQIVYQSAKLGQISPEKCKIYILCVT